MDMFPLVGYLVSLLVSLIFFSLLEYLVYYSSLFYFCPSNIFYSHILLLFLLFFYCFSLFFGWSVFLIFAGRGLGAARDRLSSVGNFISVIRCSQSARHGPESAGQAMPGSSALWPLRAGVSGKGGPFLRDIRKQ